MKKNLPMFVGAILLFCLVSINAFAAPGNSAKAMILIHADTGEVLFRQNADDRLLIASTTKIMTALVVLDTSLPGEQVKILPAYTAVEGSSMYLVAGETYTVEQLLYGMLLSSGNDAATALAFHCGGSIEGFAELMNRKAAELGLCNSSFTNPHGLDNENHYSSAADLSQITREALQNELFAKIVATKTYSIGDKFYTNHNKLLNSYQGCLGVKTGYTMAAGRSLVSAAERDGLRLICVTLSDPNDWEDHRAVLDWGFNTFEYKSVLPSGVLYEIPVISGVQDKVKVVTPGGDTRIVVKKGAKLAYRLELPEFVYAGITKGDCAGRLFLTADGEFAGEFPLYYADDVPQASNAALTAWERFKRAWFLSGKYSHAFVQGD